MTLPANINVQLLLAVAGGVLLLALGMSFWLWYRRRRAAARRLAALTGGSYAHLHNVLLPDAQGQPLHIDYLLLTVRGAVVIDLREVRGNVFGGDQMTQWTVMSRSRRYTFANPLPALLDRIAAVRALVSELPVDGQIVFDERSQFPKGIPSHVRLLQSLSDEHQALNAARGAPLPASWLEDWETLRITSQPSSVVKPIAAV